jgi:hypothetical protein
MNNDQLARRLDALQQRMNDEQASGNAASIGGPLRVVVVHGCLPPGEPWFGVAGESEFIRDQGESLDAFADRAAHAARKLGETLLVIGGLPQSQAQMDVAGREYDLWAASDDGIPPMEKSRAVPSPVQRAILQV